MTKITAQQSRFVDEHLVDLNATQAAIKADYSKKSASRIAAELLGKTQVQEAIQERMNYRSERTQITLMRDSLRAPTFKPCPRLSAEHPNAAKQTL